MLTVKRMSRWQAFVWLWRYDPEARPFWFWLWLTGVHLKDAVADNLKDFGFYPKQPRIGLWKKLLSKLPWSK